MKVSDSPYLSPVIHYDPEARVVVVQRRKPDTGEVSFQVPSEQAVRRARQDTAEAPPRAAEPETSRAATGALRAAAGTEPTGKPVRGSVSLIA